MTPFYDEGRYVAQASRATALRVYIEECIANARHAEEAFEWETRDWWIGEELAARGALIEAEAA